MSHIEFKGCEMIDAKEIDTRTLFDEILYKNHWKLISKMEASSITISEARKIALEILYEAEKNREAANLNDPDSWEDCR